MARIKQNEYNIILQETNKRKARSREFKNFLKTQPFPDSDSNNISEAYKAKALMEAIRDEGFDIWDIAVQAKGYVVKNNNDTHSKNRAFEDFLGGICNGKPEPDCSWGEIKLSQLVGAHKLEQVMTVGRIYKTDKETGERSIADKFEDSSTYQKLKTCLITTYLQQGKQLGKKIQNSFVFEVENEEWFERIKEDWEFYREEFIEYDRLVREGKRKKRASGIMKSDTSGNRSPNGTLGIRSDGIIFNKKFFMEVSKYYDK